MPLLNEFATRFRRFLSDERGAAGVEFIATLPLLLGVMILTAEYGKAMRYRMVLSTATGDVSRFLSRTPLQDSETNPGALELYPEFLQQAQDMIDARMGGAVDIGLGDSTEVAAPEIIVIDRGDPGFDIHEDAILVRVQAAADVNMPLLGFINTTLTWTLKFGTLFSTSEASASAPGTSAGATTNQIATTVTMFSGQTAPWVGSIEVNASDYNGACMGLNLCENDAGDGT